MRWEQAHDGSPHRLGYRGDRLVGQVAFYDTVNGGASGWVGYVHGARVTGRCTTPTLASELVERRSTDAGR
jgi:hypothetical protein